MSKTDIFSCKCKWEMFGYLLKGYILSHMHKVSVHVMDVWYLFSRWILFCFLMWWRRQWAAGPSNTPDYWSFPTLFARCLPSPIPPPDPSSVCTRPLWQGGVRKMNLSCVSTGSNHNPALLLLLFVHLTRLYAVWTLVMSGVLQLTLMPVFTKQATKKP